ncbi:MAG: patatin-like phospholipase family protein, partial [Myxococcota bacterium]|nr:patatin-like phospholipase family protein [Myxococcota bacterium]
PIDFFCLSSDLLSAEAHVHRQGDVVTAVGASMSIPGVAPPIQDGNRLLVDGGVLNNLPTDVMHRQAEGPIIACDINSSGDSEETSVQLPAAPIPGIARLFGAGGQSLPNIIQTLARTSLLASVQSTDAKHAIAEVVVASRVSDIGFFEFHRVGETIERGYDAAMRALEEAKERGLYDELISGRPRSLVKAERSEV